MAVSEAWNEELEKELSYECLGEPERPITEELCSNAGAKYAAVFSKAEDMVKAALEVKKLNRDAFCKLPFCVTIEAEAFGAEVSLNSLYGVPAVARFRYERVEDIPALPEMDFSTGRVREVLRAATILRDMGETVILNIEGPFTVLSQLVPLFQSCHPDVHRTARQVVRRRCPAHRLVHRRAAESAVDDDWVITLTIEVVPSPSEPLQPPAHPL